MSVWVIGLALAVIGGAVKLLAILCRPPSPLQVSSRWLDEHVRDPE
jgi:hypothetical protein